MTDFPADILSLATTTVSKISSLMGDAPTLGAAATEVIAEAILAMRPVVRKLTWSDPTPPDGKTCFYDHCRAHTPFGPYSVEWKSWKESDDCVTYGPENPDGNTFISCDGTLDGAKAAAQKDFETRILAAIRSGEHP